MSISDKNLQINSNEYLPLRDVVFTTLRQAILTGEFVPGERLMEIALADKLGVSRTPVREAIRKLELEGLVNMVPRKGAEVAGITIEDLNDVLEVRCELEVFATKLACQRITKAEEEKLRETSLLFEQEVDNKNLKMIAQRDVEFHDVIFNATKNKRLIQIMNNVREQMYRYRIEYLKDFSYHDVLVSEHREIMKEIFDKDVTKAREIMKIHINNQQMIIIGNLTKEAKNKQ